MAPTSKPGGFAIDIGDDLIAAALASVERTSRGTPRDGQTGAGASGAEGEVAAEGDGSVAAEGVDLVLDGDVAPGSARAGATASREGEVEGLREELARTRFRLDESAFALRRAEQRANASDARSASLEATLAEVRAAGETLAGDFERGRARARRDVEDAERKGEERVLTVVLELVDNLARAVAHGEASPATVVDGLRMMDGQLKRGLARIGLERVDASRGVPFDPEVHEAVATVPAPEVPPGCVVDEAASGYRLRGRLVRAARVTVAPG